MNFCYRERSWGSWRFTSKNIQRDLPCNNNFFFGWKLEILTAEITQLCSRQIDLNDQSQPLIFENGTSRRRKMDQTLGVSMIEASMVEI
jgi:hypothetical protein